MISFKGLLALALVLVCLRTVFVLGDVNTDVEATNHYLTDFGRFYGGFATGVTYGPDRWRVFHGENYGLLYNHFSFLNASADTGNVSYVLSADIDRIFVSAFVPSVVNRLTLNSLHFFEVYNIVNLIYWLVTIFCAYRLTTMYYRNPVSGLLAAIAVAVFPVLTLMFLSLKIQYAGTTYLLLFMLLHEKVFLRLPLGGKIVYYALAWIILRLAAGAWAFMVVFVLFRHVPEWTRRKRDLGIIFGTLIVGIIATALLFDRYRLISSLTQHDVVGDLLNTLEYIAVAVTGGDLSDKHFFAYPGVKFFQVVVPRLLEGLFYDNPFIHLLALASLGAVKGRRWIPLLAYALFPLANASIFLTGWSAYYGYNGGPTIALASMAAAGLVGRLWTMGLPVRRYAALALMVVGILWFMDDYKAKMGNYFGGAPDTFAKSERVYVYHGDAVTER